MRMLDLHAAACAGGVLIAIGLAGTIFFSVPVGEARGKVALYLLITMAPFALLAPVVGPLLDRFRHGRRYALATTMLGQGFLAWVIADHINGFPLYSAAFGCLVLSRAYGVARSAAVPRLLPANLGLVEAGARASLFGTFAGAVAAPIGILAFKFGPAWPLRIATVVFAFGMIVALRLPPRTDADPPEQVPRILQRRKGAKVLSGRLVIATLGGSAALRALYGFLTLFMAFAIRSGHFDLRLGLWHVSPPVALAMTAGGLGAGTFLATAICTRLRIYRPVALQTIGVGAAALAALAATVVYQLWAAALLCLVAAFASGLAKLALDAVIQEKLPETVRASAFAHSETLLMLAWVAGGGIGLLPLVGRIGTGIAAAGMIVAFAAMLWWTIQLRTDRLSGIASHHDPDAPPPEPADDPDRDRDRTTVDLARPRDPAPAANAPPGPAAPATVPTPTVKSGGWFRRRTVSMPGPAARTTSDPAPTRRHGTDPRRAGTPTRRPASETPTRRLDVDPAADDRDTLDLAPPGYHLYRPSRPTDPDE